MPGVDQVFARRRPGLGNVDDTVVTGDLGDDFAHDLVLDEEDVGHLTIELALKTIAAPTRHAPSRRLHIDGQLDSKFISVKWLLDAFIDGKSD